MEIKNGKDYLSQVKGKRQISNRIETNITLVRKYE